MLLDSVGVSTSLSNLQPSTTILSVLLASTHLLDFVECLERVKLPLLRMLNALLTSSLLKTIPLTSKPVENSLKSLRKDLERTKLELPNSQNRFMVGLLEEM